MEDDMSVARMLALVETEWHRFDRAVAAIAPGEVAAVKVVGEWTAKDLVAHVAAWERRLLGWLEAAHRGEPPTSRDPLITPDEVDAWNARVYAQHKDRPLAEVSAEAQSTHRELVQALGAIPGDPADPWWALWPPELSPWVLVAVNTYEHYPEHLLPIEARFGASDEGA